MLVHDYDDEQTMDEEEALSNEESVANELDDLQKVRTSIIIIITSVPKVIWEEGRITALLHTYAVKSPLVTMARLKFAPKSTFLVD